MPVKLAAYRFRRLNSLLLLVFCNLPEDRGLLQTTLFSKECGTELGTCEPHSAGLQGNVIRGKRGKELASCREEGLAPPREGWPLGARESGIRGTRPGPSEDYKSQGAARPPGVETPAGGVELRDSQGGSSACWDR